MRLAAVDAWLVTMRLAEPYAVAYATADTAVNVFLRVTTSTGEHGYGCAAPDDVVTGETPAGVLAACRGVVAPGLVGEDPEREDGALGRVMTALAERPSARAALDMALLDLAGRRRGVPVWRLLGGRTPRLRTSVTIGILDEAATLAAAEGWVGRGFRRLKIKGGLDPDGDLARLAKLRERFGERVELSFDANQGYGGEQAATFLRRVAGLGLEFVEQPTPAGDVQLLCDLAHSASVPLMADESLLGMMQAGRFAAARRHGGGPALFNLKLMKLGRIAEARAVLAAGRPDGIGAMVGCMDEAALGIAAGLALAVSTRGVLYADLDGHFGLEGDPTTACVGLEGDVLVASDRPGLGLGDI